jgi:hypothetical protein
MLTSAREVFTLAAHVCDATVIQPRGAVSWSALLSAGFGLRLHSLGSQPHTTTNGRVTSAVGGMSHGAILHIKSLGPVQHTGGGHGLWLFEGGLKEGHKSSWLSLQLPFFLVGGGLPSSSWET